MFNRTLNQRNHAAKKCAAEFVRLFCVRGRIRKNLAAFVSVCVISASCQANSQTAEQASALTHLRENALEYIKAVKNFMCIQTVTRSADNTGTGNQWKKLEVKELELNYSANKAHYVLLKVDGKTVDMEKSIKRGYSRVGGGVEFNRVVEMIFAPEVKAEFKWDHIEQDANKRQCVFQYKVPRETSTMTFTTHTEKIVEAHHGMVYSDCESGEISRIHMVTEPSQVNVVTTNLFVKTTTQVTESSEWDVRYLRTVIGEKEIVVPQTSIVIQHFGKTLTKSESTFRDYHKFGSEIRIVDAAEQEGTESSGPN